MDLGELGLYVLAVFVYPGVVALLAAGAVAESGASWVLARDNPLRRIAGRTRRLSLARGLPPAVSGAALLTLMAATQLAIPFNPVPAAERNLLVAGAALAGAVWLSAPAGLLRRREQARSLLIVQGAWLLALLALAIATDTLRPGLIGNAAVATLIPVKVVAGIAYVLCLPGLLGLTTNPSSELGPRGSRLLLWLPFGGLFASMFFPIPSDDAGSLLRFAGAWALAVVLAVLVAAPLSRSPRPVRRSYLIVVLTVAIAALLVAVVTSLF